MTFSTTPSTGVEAEITFTPFTIRSLSMTKRTVVPGLIFAKRTLTGETIRIAESGESVICKGSWAGGAGWVVEAVPCCAACWATSSGERKMQRADGKILRIMRAPSCVACVEQIHFWQPPSPQTTIPIKAPVRNTATTIMPARDSPFGPRNGSDGAPHRILATSV